MQNTVKLPVRQLVEFVLRSGSIDSRFTGFDRAGEGARIHRRLQKAAGSSYNAEVWLKAQRAIDDVTYLLDGRADGVIHTEDGVTVDEIKTTAAPAERLTADFNALHWAQAKCYGAFVCESEQLERVKIQLTYFQIDTEEIIRHVREYTRAELESFLADTLRLYARWAKLEAQWRTVRNTSLQQAAFPFEAYRSGQYELARAVYKTISGAERLFAAAPTGTGKTISTLFPALKAMGEEKAERIFYLTAKAITRQAAEEAVNLLRRNAKTPLLLKSITLTAKDKICLLDERSCTPDACPYANGYYDRVNDALYSFLQQENTFTRESIVQYAKAHMLCPFELALDISLWCDVIICDYNYLFDPVVQLQRFFAEGTKSSDNVFLIDEAHNLLDRAREMYTAQLCKSHFYTLKKELGKTHKKINARLTKVNNAFIELRHQCEAEPEQRLTKTDGCADFNKVLMHFSVDCEKWLEENKEHTLHADMLQLYFEVHFYLRIAQLYDDHFTTLIHCYGSEVKIQQFCLDPAPFLDASMCAGKASILFSATLSPLPYYMRTLGCEENAKKIVLKSPFLQENLCLLAADTISTKYADRSHTLDDVCRFIHAGVAVHTGNYIVYLPSYRYLSEVTERYTQLYPAQHVLVQESGMDEAARERFLSEFSAENTHSLLGFCVLGGVFSEGVDLAGDRLVGSIIVGVGLPQLCTEQNVLRSYYDDVLGQGFAYAYQYPGMNKVLQAAGRVIRTAEDKGMVLLIDCRYARQEYKALFPPHWQHCKAVKSTAALQEALHKFWGNEQL